MYPGWLNWLTVFIMFLFPLGLVIAMLGYSNIGIVVLGIAFFSVWFFGGIVGRYDKKGINE